MGRFFADVSGFVRRSKNAMDFVTKDAAQTAFHEAQLEGPSIGNGSPGNGGRMPRVSGFLGSGQGRGGLVNCRLPFWRDSGAEPPRRKNEHF